MYLTQAISADLGINREKIQKIIRAANHMYKSYTINQGMVNARTIYHPSKALKILQRWLAAKIFVPANLPILHEVAYAYLRGRSILDHANCHRKNKFLLRMDFENFFDSIRTQDVLKLLSDNFSGQKNNALTLAAADLQTILRLVCRNGSLPIGAPTSPVLSNAIMFQFDHHMYHLCQNMQVIYTRYADDLYFSTNIKNVLPKIEQEIHNYCEQNTSPQLKINTKKTIHTSSKRRKQVTGLVITPENKISLGRDKKRYLRASLHRYCHGKLNSDEILSLKGKLAFAQSVDRDFVTTALKKNGFTKIADIN